MVSERNRSIILILALTTMLLAACRVPTQAADQPQQPTSAVSAQTNPAPTLQAGHRWLISDGAALTAILSPTTIDIPQAPTPPRPELRAAWERPASTWMQHTLGSIATDQVNPPRAARILMLMGVTLNDVLQLSADARNQGMNVSDDAALATAASRVLIGLFPLRAPQYQQEAHVAEWMGVWRNETDAAGVANGRILGAAVADGVMAYAARDGADLPHAYQPLPAGKPGYWELTPPNFMPPQEPMWMHVQTIAIGDPAALRAPAPPEWGSAEMEAEIRTFREAQANLSDQDRMLAAQWAGTTGSVTPAGLWMKLAIEQISKHHQTSGAAAALYAALGVALHDAAIACWESKYHYRFARPVQVMQAATPDWLPPLETPPHPSYPSGHACFSGAAAGVLRAAFPMEGMQFETLATTASHSRLLGGIHWQVDGSAGLKQGYVVAAHVLAATEPNR